MVQEKRLCKMDLVYIIKEEDKNPDLRYSLRSVEKNVPFDNIWIVGYKPSWVQNVKYLPVKQNKTMKWSNSMKNIIAACQNEEISENFVLMNDDFFALKKIEDLEKSLNKTLGKLSKSITRHASLKSPWGKAFTELKLLLGELRVERPYYDYESHIPIIINKKKFLEIMELEPVKKYMKSGKVLHKRSLYKNMFPDEEPETLIKDVKIDFDSEVDMKSSICDWLSVFDNQVDNPAFRRLNRLLQREFPEKSKFELDNYKAPYIKTEQEAKKRRIIINPDGSKKLVIG